MLSVSPLPPAFPHFPHSSFSYMLPLPLSFSSLYLLAFPYDLDLFLCYRLQHLPHTITNCQLRALWLSENQAKPMLNLQQDVDDNTGAKVFTCFLLPQQAYHTESMGESDYCIPLSFIVSRRILGLLGIG